MTEDPVNLVLAEDIKVGDVIVARAGAKALGTITNAKRAGMLGKGGELNMKLEYLKIGDTKVRLRGTKGREGDSKTGTMVALTYPSQLRHFEGALSFVFNKGIAKVSTTF